MLCSLGQVFENEDGLKAHLKAALLNYASVLLSKYKSRYIYFTAFAVILYTVCTHLFL